MKRAALGVIWGLVLGLVSPLWGGHAHAAAAALSAPDQLPSQVRGVIGSGDQLSLQLKTPDGADRVIKVGETYQDGWTLQALSPTRASLAKDGVVREVGLNPTGALASGGAAAPPSSVTVTGVLDDAAANAILAAAGVPSDRRGAPGLTASETSRWLAYGQLMQKAMIAGGFRTVDRKALLGQAGDDDYAALQKKEMAGAQQAAMDDLAARPVTGPTSFYVPAGADEGQLIVDQGIDRRGLWSPGPLDAQGGRTVTLVAGTAEQYAARIASGAPQPPPLPLPRLPPPPPRPAP